jgi:antitoxin (DNA-binding transcriptional repressor) of toxin-antitoxin stability system
MRARISATELGRELAAILDRVRLERQSFLITQDGEAVATLEPLRAVRGTTWSTLAEALAELPEIDIDFAADLEEIQRNQPEVPAAMWPN